jgi:hypothetical protein
LFFLFFFSFLGWGVGCFIFFEEKKTKLHLETVFVEFIQNVEIVFFSRQSRALTRTM